MCCSPTTRPHPFTAQPKVPAPAEAGDLSLRGVGLQIFWASGVSLRNGDRVAR